MAQQQIELQDAAEAAAMALLSHPVSKQGEQFVTTSNAAADLAVYRKRLAEFTK